MTKRLNQEVISDAANEEEKGTSEEGRDIK